VRVPLFYSFRVRRVRRVRRRVASRTPRTSSSTSSPTSSSSSSSSSSSLAAFGAFFRDIPIRVRCSFVRSSSRDKASSSFPRMPRRARASFVSGYPVGHALSATIDDYPLTCVGVEPRRPRRSFRSVGGVSRSFPFRVSLFVSCRACAGGTH
jgi:hypothetical protein